MALGVLVAVGANRVWTSVKLRQNRGPVPWALPSHPGDRIRSAQLPTYDPERNATHRHAHLSIFLDGEPVRIPKDLGMAPPYSAIHTHSNSGIIHLESVDEAARYRLGQLFDVWGVRLDDHCAGAYCSLGKALSAYINGRRFEGRVRDVPFVPNGEVVLVLGDPPPVIPQRYNCDGASEEPDRSVCAGFLAAATGAP